ADAAVSLIDGKVPYFLAIGNHDYDRPFELSKYGRLTRNFSHYFGPARYHARNPGHAFVPSMSDDHPDNFYSVVTAGGHTYLILALEFVPSDKALEWASQVVNANPEKEVIVITHAYVNNDDTLLTTCDAHAKETYGMPDSNNGDEMWDKFVRRHPNIIMV